MHKGSHLAAFFRNNTFPHLQLKNTALIGDIHCSIKSYYIIIVHCH